MQLGASLNGATGCGKLVRLAAWCWRQFVGAAKPSHRASERGNSLAGTATSCLPEVALSYLKDGKKEGN
jgi:hypothetical protein